MILRLNIDQTLCFVIMPFRAPFDGYFHEIIKPMTNAMGLTAVRSDEIYGTGPIIQDIWTSIWKARLVIADVTTKNPNVNYGLGLCHALGVPTVLITKTMDDVPFDYRHRRCIEYNTDEAGWERKLTTKLTHTVQTVLNATEGEHQLIWPAGARVMSGTFINFDLVRQDEARVGGGQCRSGRQQRTNAVRALIADENTGPYDREYLRNRLAMLVGRASIIRIGGPTSVDRIHERYRINSAVKSGIAAKRGGVVLGGGKAMLIAAEELTLLTANSQSEGRGIAVVKSALGIPFATLLRNAQQDFAVISAQLAENPCLGYDAITRTVVDLSAASIFDATKVLRRSLEVAISQAKAILQTGSWQMRSPEISEV